MPQAQGSSKNWLINPRVPPPNNTIRLDNSAAKIENNYLNKRLRNNIDELDNRQYRVKADQKHILKTARKNAQVVFTQAKVVRHWKEGTFAGDGGPENSDSRKAKSQHDETSSSDEVVDDCVDFSSRSISSRPSNADRIRPSTVTFRLPTRSSTPSSSYGSRGLSAKGRARPKSVGPMSMGGGEGQKSYQHLKDMVENDSRKRLQVTDARTKVMLAIAEKRREDEERLQLRLQRFYTDLDQFIKRTKHPNDFRSKSVAEISPDFLMQIGNLRASNEN